VKGHGVVDFFDVAGVVHAYTLYTGFDLEILQRILGFLRLAI